MTCNAVPCIPEQTLKLKIDAACVSSGQARRTSVISSVRRTPCIPFNLCAKMVRPPRLHALICGGSIGGLTAAHALLKAGCSVTVLERASSVSSAGAVGARLGLVSRLVSQAVLWHVLKPGMSLVQGLGLDPHTESVMESLGLLKVLFHALPSIMQVLKP